MVGHTSTDIALVVLILVAFVAVYLFLRWLDGQPSLQELHLAMRWNVSMLGKYRGRARFLGHPPLACIVGAHSEKEHVPPFTVLYWRADLPGFEGLEILAGVTRARAGPLILGRRGDMFYSWTKDGRLRTFEPSAEDRVRLDEIFAQVCALLPPTLA